MRTRAAARLEGRMNVVSERFICRATACIVAGSNSRPSSKTHRGLPDSRAPPAVNTLRILYLNSMTINKSEISPTYASTLKLFGAMDAVAGRQAHKYSVPASLALVQAPRHATVRLQLTTLHI